MPTSEIILAKPLVFVIMSALLSDQSWPIQQRKSEEIVCVLLHACCMEMICSSKTQSMNYCCTADSKQRFVKFFVHTDAIISPSKNARLSIKKTAPGLLNGPNFLSTSPRIPLTFFPLASTQLQIEASCNTLL